MLKSNLSTSNETTLASQQAQLASTQPATHPMAENSNNNDVNKYIKPTQMKYERPAQGGGD